MSDRVVITTHDLTAAVPLRDAFRQHGIAVELLTPGEGLDDVQDPGLLILSGGLEEKHARRLLREAKSFDHLCAVGLADSAGDVEPAKALSIGLTECFTKPIDVDDVALVGRRLLQRRQLRLITGLLGETEQIREMLERVVQVAPVNSTVLVTGESGTGKELVARGIHALSPRKHKPFIAANVAALTETILESEVFGHEKGSFTGAIAQRRGLFELAQRGTLFLDEIGEMPFATQTKLLRVLETQQFMRVGGEQMITVDVRVIAATNQDLRSNVELGEFRRDLFYRLNVLHIELPPLRERRDDIPMLVDAFVRHFSQQHDRPRVGISADAMQVLMAYDWPGNVRELRNLIESMVVLNPGRMIKPEHIPPALRSNAGRRSLLPVHVPSRERRAAGPTPPELEFIFRTLLQLRMDVEDLRSKFEEYRREHPGFPGPVQLPYPYPLRVPALAPPQDIEDAEVQDLHNAQEQDDENEKIAFRADMTIADLEREAILAALRDSAGNRRKAADRLGIGERTLYRKLKEYDISV